MIKIYPSVFSGEIQAPPSKSYAQRLLFASAMADTATTIRNVPVCRDIMTAVSALEAFGCRIEVSGEERLTVQLSPFAKNISNYSVDINFNESATTSRIAIALAAALGIGVNAKAYGTLIQRSQVAMTGRMALRGVTFNSFSLPLKMQGKLRGGDFPLRGDEGSQFISAFLMALPCVWEDSSVILTSPMTDSSFVDITLDILDRFGINIIKKEDRFDIPAKQLYRSPGTATVENDWSLASMWVVAGAAGSSKGGRVTVNNLPGRSHQKYRHLSKIFSLMSQDFKKLNLDCSECPKLAVLFAALACQKGSTISLSGVPQLRCGETNSLETLVKCFSSCGTVAELTADGITVQGRDNFTIPDDFVIDCKGDPWVFMSLAIALSCGNKPVLMKDENCASKIYGSFLKDFAALGGKYEIIKD